MSTLFRRGDLVVRHSQHADIMPIAFNMRHADTEEIWASNMAMPMEALTMGLEKSRPCLSAEYRGRLVAMVGIVPSSPVEATIWMLGTPQLDQISKAVCRMSLMVVKKFIGMYPTLSNFVDVRNKKSIEWLKWLGASFRDPAPYGALQMPFQMFTIERGTFRV